MLRWDWLLVGIALSQATPASCGEKPQPLSAKEIKALIDGLVSPNPAPDEGKLKASEGKPDGGFPRDFDHKKQKQVHRVPSKLTQLGTQAFPFLIERWADKRYCLTTEEAAYVNQTVGVICQRIIYDQLQPYGYFQKGYEDPRGKPLRPHYPEKFLGSQEVARQWWKKNKDKTLYEIQRTRLPRFDFMNGRGAGKRPPFPGTEKKVRSV